MPADKEDATRSNHEDRPPNQNNERKLTIVEIN